MAVPLLRFVHCPCGASFPYEIDTPSARSRIIWGMVWGGDAEPVACPDCRQAGWLLVGNDDDFLPDDVDRPRAAKSG